MPTDPARELIIYQASVWLTKLQCDRSPPSELLAAFARWLTQSPLHIREFLLMTALDRELQLMDVERVLKVCGPIRGQP